ncbi:MBL fold metallo-hydrolase [Falsiroseomonas sp. HW251]|uniref:MBL fold metallo-hydrolase n=1 Tax=Falsiroseomonas sp. HW251 TaxID=3390998 RepID=UPI003D318B0B
MNRRAFLAAAALPGMPALMPRPARAQAAAPPPTIPLHRTRVGALEVTVVNDGSSWRPDATAGFVVNASPDEVRGVLAAQNIATTILPNSWNVTLVRTGGQAVLLDTGRGGQGRVAANLAAAGTPPEQVTRVAITHFHLDHIGGLVRADGTPAFPNAQVIVPEREWAFWTDAGEESRAAENRRPGFAAVRRILGAYGDRVARFAPGATVAPGITAVATPGHSPGHSSFLVADGSEQLMVIGDVATSAELFLPMPQWVAGFDMDQATAAATRAALLDRLATDRVRLVAYHFVMPGLGRVERAGQGYRFVPVA